MAELTSEDFGDFDPDDAWDNAPADPLQVAMRLHRIREKYASLVGRDPRAYVELPQRDGDDLLFIAGRICQWTQANSPAERGRLGEKIHQFTALRQRSLQPWAGLSDEELAVAQDIADQISDWLIRQGAWQ